MFKKSECYLAGLMVLLMSLILIALSCNEIKKTVGVTETIAISSAQEILTHKAAALEWDFNDDPYFPSQHAVPVNNLHGSSRHRNHTPVGSHIASTVPADQENPEFTLGDNMHTLPELDNAIFTSTDIGAVIENAAMDN